jgi:iron complex outermembrane receptor protein
MLITRALRTPNAFVLASGLLLLASACPGAAFADLGATMQFNIAPQPLQNAVIQYTDQSGVQITSAAELLKGRKSAAVVGTFSASAALTKLLGGTELEFDVVDPNTVAIRAKGQNHSASSKPLTDSPSVQPPSTAGLKVPADRFRVAQADQGASGETSSVERKKKEVSEKKADQLEEIVVTGSRLKIKVNEGPQEVKVYTREQIDQSGQTTVADFLNTLPDVSVAIGENGFQTFAGGTTVQLHGLPVGTTLVLLDGRRLETSGSQGRSGDFFDLNNIPLSAVERIDVVADGSSAVYGSDAIAGVVNIILKKDFDGFEAKARYGGAAGTHEWDNDLAWGKRWDSGSFSIIGSYQSRSELDVSARELTQSNDYRAFGGADNNGNTCNPGNVYSIDGATPLPGLGNATFAAVPRGFTGTPSIQEFARTAGALNECSFAFGSNIFPATERAGIFIEGNYRLTRFVELFTELMYSHVQQLGSIGFNGLFGSPGAQNQSFTVAAANPYNPFGTDVGISGLFTSNPLRESYGTVFVRPLVGARGSVLNSWQWEISAWDSRDSTKHFVPSGIENATLIQNALNSTDSATALNPFVNGPYGQPQLLQSLFSDLYETFAGQGQAINGFMRGPLFQLPSGPIELVIGAEYDRDTLSFDEVNDGFDPPNTLISHGRHSYAMFGEARIPIVANHVDLHAGETLALTLAARHDHYDDFGTHNTPQLGAEWRPADTLLIRASYARAFKAPALLQLDAPILAFPVNLIDPLSGNAVHTTRTVGGNPALSPETGNSRTIGVVWSSQAIQGLQLSLTHWSVNETDAIQAPSYLVILANESLFPGRVTRDANGNITLINGTYVNFGKIEVSGLDYRISHQHPTWFGTFTSSLTATQTYRYSTALTPNSPAVDATSIAQDSGNWAPRWKGTAAFGWKRGPYSANFDARYVGRYQDYDSTQVIGNFWLADVNCRLAVGQFISPDNQWLKGAYAEFGAVNLFNKLPQFSNAFFDQLGYDPAQADIRGRFVYAQLGVKW